MHCWVELIAQLQELKIFAGRDTVNRIHLASVMVDLSCLLGSWRNSEHTHDRKKAKAGVLENRGRGSEAERSSNWN